MSDQPPTLEQHIATAQHLAEFSTEATDPGAATSSIAHSLCALNLQVAQLTGIVSDGVTAIQQHLPLAATDRHRALALQEQGVAAIRELTEAIRAVGAERSATPEQPKSPAEPEGRYLHEKCGCAEDNRYIWFEEETAWRYMWSAVPMPWSHCKRCGAHLLTPDECRAIGQPAGTAVAFAPVALSEDAIADIIAKARRQRTRIQDALNRANDKLGLARTLLAVLQRDINAHDKALRNAPVAMQSPVSWANVLAAANDLGAIDLTEEAATDAD